MHTYLQPSLCSLAFVLFSGAIASDIESWKLDNEDNEAVDKGPVDYFTVTDPVPSGPNFIDVTNPGPGLSSAVGDGQTDDRPALQRIINSVAGQGKTVYFPPGKYRISTDVTIKNDVKLLGSEDGISLIMSEASNALATTMGNKKSNNDGNIRVERLFFDGVTLEFGHNSHSKHDITISHCVFFSKNPPGTGAKPQRGSVYFTNIKNSDPSKETLAYSVFLRDTHAFNYATRFQDCDKITMRKNIFGLDLGNTAWLTSELSGEPYWSNLKPKLSFLHRHWSLGADQGCIKCGIQSGFCNKTLIEKNIFNGSPNFVPSATVHHDHVVYLKGFNDMKFLENYARGWPSDPTGGIKARNGKGLVIARNYIDDTGILLYTHLHSARPIYLGLKDVLVYGNYIVERTNKGHRTSGISYMEPDFAGDDENLTYSANKFEIEGSSGSPPPSEACINLGNSNQDEHHVFRDNVYAGTNPPAEVVLEARSRFPTPQYENGTVSSSLIASYVSKSVPNYTIPDYAPNPSE